ncbi:MAG: hypothetical protein ABIS67_13640, partial [Candidatus Eisenbacteria bacterium]
ARVRDLAGDPALTGWLDRNGLALEEAARIQPAYAGIGGAEDAASNPGTWAASAIGAGVGLTGVGLNVSLGASRNQRNTRGFFGVLCGVLGAGLGLPGFLGDGGVRALGAADIGVGLVSFGLGIRQLNAAGEARPQAAAHSIAPAAWCDGGGARRIGLVMRF